MTTLAQSLIKNVREHLPVEEFSPAREKALTAVVSTTLAASGYQGSMNLTYYALTDQEVDRLTDLLVHHLQVGVLSPDYDGVREAMHAAVKALQAESAAASSVVRV